MKPRSTKAPARQYEITLLRLFPTARLLLLVRAVPLLKSAKFEKKRNFVPGRVFLHIKQSPAAIHFVVQKCTAGTLLASFSRHCVDSQWKDGNNGGGQQG